MIDLVSKEDGIFVAACFNVLAHASLHVIEQSFLIDALGIASWLLTRVMQHGQTTYTQHAKSLLEIVASKVCTYCRC